MYDLKNVSLTYLGHVLCLYPFLYLCLCLPSACVFLPLLLFVCLCLSSSVHPLFSVQRQTNTAPSLVIMIMLNLYSQGGYVQRFPGKLKELDLNPFWGNMFRGPAKKTKCTRHLASKLEIITGQI